MFRGNSDAYVSAIIGRLFDKEQQCLRQPLVICSQGTALLTKSYFRHSLHSKSTTMASMFFVNSNSEPEIVGTGTITEAAGSNSTVVLKDINRDVSSMFSNEEHMSIDDLLLQISDDMLLPSITTTEITKIRLGEFISITEVRERDVYIASLPRISIHDKGKAILEDDEPIL
ncbi:hypothetical protein F511_38679 [Dorcoceras hygrometricum]|uniref:Uncharacterized protein n=1 Tax=Dorcoceras hygrometricum TaxID=472368 RepID=A0A2Z7DE15_9LAMI|nr:hypothetical protein F511_38679 [Dorcoceras hygrometricum]